MPAGRSTPRAIAPGAARVHSFQDSLALSESYANADWWLPLYRRMFPRLQSAVSVREDGWAQRGGVDRVLTPKCGRTYTVDEKIRTEDWPDILLEQWSDEARKCKRGQRWLGLSAQARGFDKWIAVG